MKNLIFFTALCSLIACQAPDSSEMLVYPTNVEGPVVLPGDKTQDCIHFGRVVSTQLDNCGPVILLDDGILLEARIVPEPAPKILYTLGHPVQVGYRILNNHQSECLVDFVVELTCIREPEGDIPYPIDFDSFVPGDEMYKWSDFSVSQETGDDRVDDSFCKWTGKVIQTDVTACGLLIRLDNGIQLEPRNPDARLVRGQRIRLSYIPWKDQTSTCDAGIVVHITCLEILDEREVSYEKVDRSETY